MTIGISPMLNWFVNEHSFHLTQPGLVTFSLIVSFIQAQVFYFPIERMYTVYNGIINHCWNQF